MAFGEALKPQPKSLYDAILKNGLLGITRASGSKPAGGWDKRGNNPLIQLYRNDKYFSHKNPHTSIPPNVIKLFDPAKGSFFNRV